jgi:hypothetical protein
MPLTLPKIGECGRTGGAVPLIVALEGVLRL